ncbi:class I SAM-dependent methyltransferase [Flavitalea sp. BT771]|uniref:class I SAM-dependent methyltransferase n=1 Tax=Flavitalea sp. BT771 TaxID=3063329 RepID=UPI0026E4317E|nr:class I SAM-dependent methyltransferase [Flavitalea sp. BT771]MDO6431638.1 class I SAM-dependent methyltransferase [Flavitalea sp. BT771]MDV6220546.1 class I SAM-dependent methyltransferase [Flavitalea sp. BT771]
MENSAWFAKEEDWMLKRSVIFNKNLVMLTFMEVERLVRLLGGLPRGSRVLDLCCGIGRHSLEFARNGFDVTGVDITKPYLEIAKDNADREGLSIKFVHSDMKDFCQPGAFDLVANLCTSFGYFEDINDDLLVLKNAWMSLAPNGKFIIEILGKEVIASTFRKVEELEYDDCRVVAESTILNDWNLLECKRTITRGDSSDEITAYHRLYSATELKGHLKEAGFRNIKVYGNFAGAPYDNHARSMIMVGEK